MGVCVNRIGTVGSSRSRDRRAERRGHRGTPRGHALCRDGRRHGHAARSSLSRRCSTVSQGSAARFSAARRTPTDPVIASQTVTDRLPRNSRSRSRGFALPSREATGTTCFARALKRKEHAHDHDRFLHRSLGQGRARFRALEVETPARSSLSRPGGVDQRRPCLRSFPHHALE